MGISTAILLLSTSTIALAFADLPGETAAARNAWYASLGTWVDARAEAGRRLGWPLRPE